MRESKRFFDLEEVRSLPIKDVCAAFGIAVTRSNFIKLRPEEKTASTKLYINKGTGVDRFYDFGSQTGGDCINLIQEYRGCSWQDALETVADAFGIQPINNFDYEQRGTLTDLQWAKIGIYGDLVTKNLDFDLEKFSVDSASKYASKYQMTVNELRDSNPNFYIAAILRNKAFPFVYGLRNEYFLQIYSEQSFQKNIIGNSDFGMLSKDKFAELEESRRVLASAEKLLRLALRGTDVKFSFREYSVEKDWIDISLGKVSFEIGSKNNADIKQYARKNNLDVCYTKISADDYFVLAPEDSEEAAPYAAFLKGDTVNLVYTTDNIEKMSKMFNIETVLPESSVESQPTDLSAKISQAENKKDSLVSKPDVDSNVPVDNYGDKIYE